MALSASTAGGGMPALGRGAGAMVTVMGANLLGDALRDLWDPRLLTPH